MLSRHSHSLALALVVSTLALILSGAAQLGSAAGEPHRGLSGLVAVLTIVTTAAVWTQQPAWLRVVAAGCLAAVVALGVLGFIMSGSPWAIVLHACLSHAFFAGTVALSVATSALWQRAAARVADTGSPSLRTLGLAVPIAVFLQIFLGAIYRHANQPVWPHLTGSLIVGCVLLYTGMVVLETHAEHPALKLAAQVLVGVTVAQIALGLGAFLGRVMAADHLSPEWWMSAARMLHVATGAATLGASVAYALQAFHHIEPRTETTKSPIGKSAVA
jgi:hypothetical protein